MCITSSCPRTTVLLMTSIHRPESSLGPGRLLATFLCLLLLSLGPLMFECVSLLIVSVSLVDMVFFGLPLGFFVSCSLLFLHLFVVVCVLISLPVPFAPSPTMELLLSLLMDVPCLLRRTGRRRRQKAGYGFAHPPDNYIV